MTSSLGIGPNKMLAKICSELDKPNGQTYLPFENDTIIEFMQDKKLRDVPGIGSVMEQTLNGFGIHTCKDIENHLAEVYINFSEQFFEFLCKASHGIGRNRHDESDSKLAKKSISFTKSFRSISRFE